LFQGDGTTLLIVFAVGAVQPQYSDSALVCFDFFFTPKGASAEQRYELESEAGKVDVYDYTTKAVVAGSKGIVEGTGFKVTLPIEKLAAGKFTFPVALRLESRSGHCYETGGNSNTILDKAPNAGTVTYG
jgi:hypothetical protein